MFATSYDFIIFCGIFVLSHLQLSIEILRNFVRHEEPLNHANKAGTAIIVSYKCEYKRLSWLIFWRATAHKYLHVMRLIDKPYCPKCVATETAEHLLCHFPAYINARWNNFILPTLGIHKRRIYGLGVGVPCILPQHQHILFYTKVLKFL